MKIIFKLNDHILVEKGKRPQALTHPFLNYHEMYCELLLDSGYNKNINQSKWDDVKNRKTSFNTPNHLRLFNQH